MVQSTALRRLVAISWMVLLASACTIEVDEPVEPVGAEGTVPAEGTNPVMANEVEQPAATVPEPSDSTNSPAIATPSDMATAPDQTANELSSSVQVDSNAQQPSPGLNPDPTPVQITDPQLDQSGIATSEAVLMDLLLTDHIVENDGRVKPTSVWICTDVFEDTRNYFFYDVGVINSVRAMVIERTLSQTDNTFVDIRFFWSVTSADSILLSSLMPGEDGNPVTSGQQWDVTTIRFSEVDSRPVFTAQSVLRGGLSCAAFAL